MTAIPARLYSRPRTPRLLVAFRLLLYGCLVAAAVWGGSVVRVAAICAIPLALLIDWEGGVRHLLRMAGLALAVWLAPKYGSQLGDFASSNWGVSPAIGTVAGIGVLGLVIVLVGGIVARLASRHMRRGRASGAFDHMLGGVLGTAEAGLAVACGCWMLAALAGPLASVQAHAARSPNGAVAVAPAGASPAGGHTVTYTPATRGQPAAPAGAQQTMADAQQIQLRILNVLSELGAAVRDDPAGQWLTQSNPLKDLTPVRTAGLMLEVAADPGALVAAIDKGQLDAIAALPELRKYTEAIQNDPELREALQRQDFAAVLSHPLIKSMLTDSELRRVLLDNVDELRKALSVDEDVIHDRPESSQGGQP